MNFYFYTNENMLFDYLGRNLIAPDTVIRDIKQYRTISTAADHCLFVTHKKLGRACREQGIAKPEFVCPVTLMLSEGSGKDEKAVLVKKTEDGYVYDFKPLGSYDPEVQIGAYLIGEVPLSRVEKIYFDTQNDQDTFVRPSPDYWYPTEKYALLPEDFNEELSLGSDEEKILKAAGITAKEIVNAIARREKLRAAMLNFVAATMQWQYGRYAFTMDRSLQKLLGLTDEALADALPHYAEAAQSDEKGNERIVLVGEEEGSGEDINQKLFDLIRDALLRRPYNTKKQPGEAADVLAEVSAKAADLSEKATEINLLQRLLSEIGKLVSDVSDQGPEEIFAMIPEPVDVLKAFLLVLKNPDKYDLFLQSMGAYHVDVITRRRACVLWGCLNGLYGMPGEGYGKDQALLWQFIEATAAGNDVIPPASLAVDKPEIEIKGNTVLDIKLKEKRIVTAGEVREKLLAMPKEKIGGDIYKKLLDMAEAEAGSKKKAQNRGYAHCVASTDLKEIKYGDPLDPAIRKKLEQLLKDCKKPVPNEEKLYSDYLEDEKKFAIVYNRDPDYWKRAAGF